MKPILREAGGYSLVEVVMALFILVLLAMGISQSLVLSRGIAETNIREVTANAVASGYIEQLKSMEYQKILTSVRDPAVPVPTILTLGEPDPLHLNQWVEKSVVIDEDQATGSKRRMPLHVRLEIEDLSTAGNGAILAITVFYAWEDAKTRVRRDRAFRTMRSYVPTF